MVVKTDVHSSSLVSCIKTNGSNKKNSINQHLNFDMQLEYIEQERDLRCCTAVTADDPNQPTLSDSGSNIDIISNSTAALLETKYGFPFYPVLPGSTPQYVMFGRKDAKAKITGYMYGCGLMGQVAVVEEVTVNLISVKNLCQQHLTVSYTKSAVLVLSSDGTVVHRGYFDEELELWRFDITSLMLQEVPRQHKIHPANNDQQTSNTAYGAIKPRGRVSARQLNLVRELHIALQHLPYSTMADALESGAWRGISPEITPALCRRVAAQRNCVICAECFWTQDHEVGSGLRVFLPGEWFAFDNIGTFLTPSMGCTKACNIEDMGTGYGRVYGIKKKTQVIECIRLWIIEMLSYGWTPKGGFCDAGSVETGLKFKDAMAYYGLQVIPNPPKTPQPDIERAWGTNHNHAAAVICNTKSFNEYDWLPALGIAQNIRNTVPNAKSRKIDSTKSPLEIITGRKVDMAQLQHLRPGDVAVVQKDDRKIGRPRNTLGRVLEVDMSGRNATTVQLMDGSDRVIERAGAKKISMTEPYQTRSRTVRMTKDAQGDIEIAISGASDDAEDAEDVIEQETERQRENERFSDDLIANLQNTKASTESPTGDNVVDTDSDEEHDPSDMGQRRAFWTRFINLRKRPCTETDEINAHRTFFSVHGYWAAIEMEDEQDEDFRGSVGPESYMADDGDTSDEELPHIIVGGQADTPQPVRKAYKAYAPRTDRNPSLRRIKSNAEMHTLWEPIINKESSGMIKLGAMKQLQDDEYADEPITPHVTDCSTRRDDSKKARICINGKAEKKRGVFPSREFLRSPAMEEVLLRFLYSLGAYYRLLRKESDVAQCFQNVPMSSVRIPRNIVIFLSELECRVPGGARFLMQSCGYGTADAGREWFIIIEAFFLDQGFSQCDYNECLFVKHIGTEGIIIIGVATDNTLRIHTRDPATIEADQELMQAMDNRWKMTHGEHSDLLGVVVTENLDESWTLTQPSQIKTVQDHFYPNGKGPYVIAPGKRIAHARMNDKYSQADYMSGLGKCGYLRLTRADLRAGMAILGESLQDPTVKDAEQLEWIASMICTTKAVGLTFHAGPRDASIRAKVPLHGSSDAAWSTEKTSQSRLGFMIGIGLPPTYEKGEVRSAPFLFKSMKEKSTVSPSASVAELHSAVEVNGCNKVVIGMLRTVQGVPDILGSQDGSTPMMTTLSSTELQSQIPGATFMTQDNASLHTVISTELSGQARKLKTVTRYINIIKQSVQDVEITFNLVPREHQDSDGLTRAAIAPTIHWKRIEVLQGSSTVVSEFQEIVNQMKHSRLTQGKEIEYGGATTPETSSDSILRNVNRDIMDVGVNDSDDEESDMLNR